MENKAGRVLIVEDEWLIAAALEDMLTELGFSVLGPVPTSSQALALIDQTKPDCALLDVSLGSEKSFAVANVLKARGIPFAFLTGYLARDLPIGCADAPMLAKPFRDRDLRKLMPSLLETCVDMGPST